jgi:hypothetical protein
MSTSRAPIDCIYVNFFNVLSLIKLNPTYECLVAVS